MSVTLEHVRLFILTCTQAFAGKRGRSGIIGYLRGETTQSTVELGRDSGVEDLYGSLKGVDSEAIHDALGKLLTGRMLESRKVEIRGTEMPLLFITDIGLDEIRRIGATGLATVVRGIGTPDKMRRVLTRIGDLLVILKGTEANLTEGMQQKVQLLGKALGLKADVHMASPPGRRLFAESLVTALQRHVFAYLPEVEAQCLRHVCGIHTPNQLTGEELTTTYGDIDVSALAQTAAARIAARNWPHKSQLVSVLGFLAITQR